MPIYRANGKTYDIPESKVSAFEKHYPDATVEVYDGATGKGYNIPVSKSGAFKKKYPGWSYGRPAGNAATGAEPKATTPKQTDAAVGTGSMASWGDSHKAAAKTTGARKGTQKAWRPTSLQKAMMISEIQEGVDSAVGLMQNNMENARRIGRSMTQKGRDERKSAETLARMAGTPTKVLGLTPSGGSGSGGMTGSSSNPISPTAHGVKVENGKAKTEWQLPDGSLTTNLMKADEAEYGARRARLQHEFIRRMEQNGLDPTKQEDVEKQQKTDLLDTAEKRTAIRLRENEKNLRGLYAERGRELDEEGGWNDDEGFLSNFVRIVGGAANRSVRANAPKPKESQTADDKARGTYLAENQILTDAQKLLETRKLNKSTGFMGGFWNVGNNWRNMKMGAKHAAQDADLYAGGVVALQKASELMGIEEKLKQGEDLSDAEVSLVYSTMLGQDVAHNIETPHGYNAAQITVEMFPFMAQMVLNPASGLSRAIVTKYGKAGLRKIAARKAAEGLTGEAAEAFAKKEMRKLAAKTTGVQILGDLAESAVLANTLQAPKTAANAMERYQGEVAENQEGDLTFDGSHNWGEAIYKAQASAIIENYTEMLGSHFGIIGNAAGKAAKKGLQAIGGGKVLDAVSSMIEKVGSTEWAKAIGAVEKRAQWNGTVGEVLEEEAGIVLNSIFTGDNSISDLWDADQQIDIVLGVGLFGGFVSGLKTAGYPIARAKAKSNLRKQDGICSWRFGDEWSGIREAIESADERDLGTTIRDLVRDHAKSQEQGKAIAEYAHALMRARGLEISSETRRAEGSMTQEEHDIEESFDHGVEIGGGEDTQAMSDARRLMERERGRLASSLSEDEVAAYDDDPIGALSRTEDPEVRQMAADYVNAKAAYDGMIQRVRDDIDGEVSRAEAEIDGRTNRETGLLQPATMKGDDSREVYIVSGSVAMFDDGSGVDPERSSESVIIRDAETGKVEFADPLQIMSVGEATDAEEAKASERERIWQENARAAADRIDGKLDFGAGATYSVLDMDGNPEEITILGNSVDENGHSVDGSVDIQYADGTIQSVSAENLQQWVDAANERRVEQFAEERDAERASAEEAMTSASPEDRPADAASATAAESAAEMPADATNATGGEQGAEIQAGSMEDSREQASALERIAKDDAGNPLYESATPDLAWDVLLEQAEGDEEMALEIAEEQRTEREATWDAAKGVVTEIEEELAVAKSEKPALPEGYKEMSIADQIKARKEAKAQTSEKVMAIETRLAEAQAAADAAEAAGVFWEETGKTKQLREEAAAKAEAERLEAERRAERERKDAAAKAEAERLRREKEVRDGMPDMADDTPADARARGARKTGGTVYRRQEPITDKVEGKEVTVDFNEKKEGHRPKGRLVVIEAAQGQASHMEGRQNPLFFIDEAQPKDRTDAESVIAEQRHAREMDPALITDSRDMVDPFRGAPTVNARGETIQGNHRMATLRYMYANEPEAQKRYRDYLYEHAEEFGFTPEQARAIAFMEEPVLVNMLDVDDDMAIELGLDTGNSRETGGKDRIDTDRLATSIGDKMGRFMDTLLTDDSEEGESLRSLIRRNGLGALKYLRDMGKIDDRQYGTAIARDGSLSDEGVEDLEKFIKRTFFAGESKEFEEMFDTLPAKAQGAVLSQIWRDTRTAERDRLTPHVKEAVKAYYAMSSIPQFKESRNVKDALRAVEMWRMQTEIGEDGDIVNNQNKHSNLALHLAAMMKGATMKETRSVLNQMLDWMQADQTGMADMFADEETDEDRTLEAAVRKVLGIEYKGGEASPVMADANALGSVTNGEPGLLDKEKELTKTDSYGENGGADVAGADQGEPQGEHGSESDGRGRERAAEGVREAESGGGTGALGVADSESGISEGEREAPSASASARTERKEESEEGPKYDRSIPTTPDAQRSAISRIIEFAKNIKDRVERAVIGGITKRQAKDFADMGLGVDDTWVHSFESSAVSHNQKHHGNAKGEEARGQIAITAEDYSKIPDILEGYDRVSKSSNKTKGTENEVIIYEKEFDDGYVYYLEEKRDNRKSLAFHTMYKKKKGTDSSDGFAADSTAPITPKATPDNLDSNSDGKDNALSGNKQAGAEKSSEGAEVSPEDRPADSASAMTSASSEDRPADAAKAAERELTADAAKAAERELTAADLEGIGPETGIDESVIDGARDYLEGERGAWAEMCYKTVKEYVRNTGDNSGGDGRTGDETQLAGGAAGTAGRGLREDGGGAVGMDGRDGGEGMAGDGERGENPAGGVGAVSGAGGIAETGGEATGADAKHTDTGDTGRGGVARGGRSNVRKAGRNKGGKADAGDAGKRNAEADGASGGTEEVRKSGEETAQGMIDDALETLRDIFRNPGMSRPGQLNDVTTLLAGLGVNAARFLGATAKLGCGLVMKGYYKYARWQGEMHRQMDPLLHEHSELTDDQITEYIRSAWDMKMSYRGERKKVSEWAAELEAEELRKLARMDIAEKRRLQAAAEGTEVKTCDLDNIRDTLPFLLPAQHEDVEKAERQFFKAEHSDREHGYGKGYLFTNGTGTGKTYTGLGIAKRFIKQGKSRILIVTVNDTKISDWIKDAGNLGIEAKQLADTKSKGNGVVVTQYANLRQNYALLEDEFDLIIYDESHKLMENQEGQAGSTAEMHHLIAARDARAVIERELETSELGKRRRAARAEAARLSDLLAIAGRPASMVSAKEKEDLRASGYRNEKEIEEALKAAGAEEERLSAEIEKETEAALADESRRSAAEEVSRRTKTVFLSATPFNTPASLDYTEGYIFSYPEEKAGMKRRDMRNDFLRKNFGKSHRRNSHGDMARMSEGQITDPEGVEEEEIRFSNHLQDDLHTMSGRMLDSAYDYSRSFPRFDLPEAKLVNTAMSEISKGPLEKYFKKTLLDYNYSTAFWEIIKTGFALPRIKEHIAKGRKVVVFHRRKSSSQDVYCPFASGLKEAMSGNSDVDKMAAMEFAKKYRELLAWEASLDYSYPQDRILQEFVTDEELAEHEKEMEIWREKRDKALSAGKKAPKAPKLKSKRVGIFNGDQSASEKQGAVDNFNLADSNEDVIVVQVQSGKEGISLHDTDGKRQRVMMSLALPQSPIEFIQAEGRIYRVGNQSDAIFEYPLLGIDRELYDFAMKINGRSQTSENLAMGSKSRGLRDSITRGALGSTHIPVTEGQGKGGKMLDSRETQQAGGFDHAMENWKEWREKEEVLPYDERSIPDPLGFKLMEWGGAERGETVLVAYAGEGSVARYAPTSAKLIALESDSGKLARLAALLGGGGRKILGDAFMTDSNDPGDSYSTVNKADVVVVKTRSGVNESGLSRRNRSVSDIRKALSHTEDSGRVVAIVPTEDLRGVSGILKSIDDMRSREGCVTRSVIDLPENVFGKAVSVVVIDKNEDPNISEENARKPLQRIKAEAGETAEETLKGLRETEVENRVVDRQAKAAKRVKRVLGYFNNSKLVSTDRWRGKSEKTAHVSRVGVHIRFTKHIVPTNAHLSRVSNGISIDFKRLSQRTYLEELAEIWSGCRKAGEMSIEEYMEFYSGTFRSAAQYEEAHDAMEHICALIEAATGKTATQLGNIAEGKTENEIKRDMTLEEFRDIYKSLDSGSEEIDALAERVFAVAGQIKGLRFTLADGSEFSGHNVMAHYAPGKNAIELNADVFNAYRTTDAQKAQCILHETIHAVTCWAYARYKDASEAERATMGVVGEACRDIEQVYKAINNDSFRAELQRKSKLEDNAMYGLSDEYEMLAEMANPVFRSVLKGKRLWRQLVNGVKKLFGIDVTDSGEGATTAYDVLNGAIDRILENFDAREYERYTSDPHLSETRHELVGKKISEREATELIERMKATAEVAPVIELTPENWIAQFGEDGAVETPIGIVKMGENQYFKMARQGREGKLGMVKPTLQAPEVIIEDYRPASGGKSERDSSYIFVKTFRKEDGSRYYNFTSVTVRKGGREVVISNQERSEKRISTLLQEGKVAWIDDGILHPKSQVGKSVSLNDSSNPTKSDNRTARLGINSSANDESMSLSSEMRLTEAPGETEGPDLVPTSDKLSSEGEAFLSDKQAKKGNSSSANRRGGQETEEVYGGEEDGNIRYRLREEEPPRQTGTGYKVFVLRDGKLYPPMVANPNGEATPVGVWLDADAAPVAGTSKTGRQQVKAGGRGTQGGSGRLAYRPGWHLGVIPYALQFNRKGESGEKELFPADFVWAEVEYADDVDYQEEAMSYGYNKNGKFQHSYAGLPRVPKDGAYKYRTNPNPETDPWIITGAMKVNRLLTPTEVDAMVRSAGREPQKRQAGAVTDAEVEALNRQIAEDRLREGDGSYSDTEVSVANDPWAKAWGASYRSLKERRAYAERERARMRRTAERLSGALGVEIEVLEDAEGLTGRKRRAKGWYDKGTGKVTVIISNHRSAGDMEATILHEAVAHHGLRELLGAHFDEFLDKVYSAAENGIKERIDLLATRNGWNRRVATEEYLAGLAEDMDFEGAESETGGWLDRIKQFFIDMLFKAGFKHIKEGTLSDNELRYVLWRSYQNLAHPGRYRAFEWEAEDVAMQDRLGVGAYSRSERARGESSAADSARGDAAGAEGSSSEGRPIDEGTQGGEAAEPRGRRRLKKDSGPSLFDWADSKKESEDEGDPARQEEDRESEGEAANAAIDRYAESLGDFLRRRDALEESLSAEEIEDEEKSAIISQMESEEESMAEERERLESILKDYYARTGDGKDAENKAREMAWRVQAEVSGRISGQRKLRETADFSPEDRPADATDESGVLFRDGDFTARDRALAAAYYERMLSRGSWQFREAMQDSMLGLKALYEAVLTEGSKARKRDFRIEEVAGYENAYLYENRMSSANNGEQHEYFTRYMRPLLEEIHKICGKDELERRALTDYMMAKHGLERNAYMRAEASANGEETERDFAGLCGLTGEDDWQAAEAAAQQMIDDYEFDHDTAQLWKSVRRATRATLDKIYMSGLISEETYTKTVGMYDYYIPLRGWDETTSDEVYGYLTSKDGPLLGSVWKHAEGRKSKAEDPIAYIAQMADDAIRQGNRNIMKQRFLNFAQGHPSDLVSVNKLWLQHNEVTDEWEPVFADLEPEMTPEEVEAEIAKFEEKMKELAAKEPKKYKRGRDARNIPYKVKKGNMREHQVLVKRNGRTYVMTINGNPRAAQALNGLTNPDTETGGVVGNMLKLGEYVNRNLSAFYTTRNPDFVVSNFLRDMLYSNAMTWVKENPRYALRFHRNFGRVNPARLRGLLHKWENGELDESVYLERMMKEFMLNGGETGYTSVKDIEQHKRTIAAELRKQGSAGRKAWAALGRQLDLLNRSTENCARFAAFLTSREMGRTLDRSIHDAKEISVNFNKKGAGGKFVKATGQKLLGKIGSYLGGGGRIAYVFWNAGVQGMTNFGRAGKRNPGRALAGAGALFTLGIAIPLLAQMLAGDGDDDKNAYYNLPEYVRRSNICFKAGEQWVTIPLPIEYRAIYGLGELATGVISGNERYSDAELARQLAAQVSQTMPLDMLEGGGGISPFIPSAVKPPTEAYVMNRGWTGLPVYKDTPFNKNDPEWTKAYASADQHLVGFAKWLNETTGGDDYKKGRIDINPAKLEYLLNGTFGGVFSFPTKVKKSAETAFGDREFEWRNMPLANRVVKSGDERTANRKLREEYFKYKAEAEETGRLRRKYENAKAEGILGYAERADFLYNSGEYLRYEIYKEYEPEMDAIREELKDATNRDARKALEDEMHAKMRELVDSLRTAEK